MGMLRKNIFLACFETTDSHLSKKTAAKADTAFGIYNFMSERL